MRALWSAVILQAIEDVRTEPLDSVTYNEAVAFFTSGGEWLKSRVAIGDYVNMSERDIRSGGMKAIAKRRARAGLPPELPAVARTAPVLRAYEPRSVKVASPVRPPLPSPPRVVRQAGRRLEPGAKRYVFNPFDCRLPDRK